MAKTSMRFTSQIAGLPNVIFDLVADMPNYPRWLPDSASFGGTINVSPYPVRLGTTYLDAGPIEKPGSVTEFDRPTHIGFRHTVQIRRGPIRADIDARIRYSFEPRSGGTFVQRELELTSHLQGLARLLKAVILWSFRKENVRTLAKLKHYVEAEQKR